MSGEPAGLAVGRGVVVPWDELVVRRSRSGGPGGQHVNKVETQVEVRWDVAASRALTETQRGRVARALGHRLVGGSVLVVRSRAERSQERNRRAALERLAELVNEALRPRKRRRATRPTAASRAARLAAKRRRAARKRERARPTADE